MDLLEDQKSILNQIVSLSEDCESILIAGDIYDVSVPSCEAMSLYEEFIEKLINSGKRVYAISGNHDSTDRLSHFSYLLYSSGYFISEKYCGKLQRFTEEDEFGKVNIYLLPFIRTSNVS